MRGSGKSKKPFSVFSGATGTHEKEKKCVEMEVYEDKYQRVGRASANHAGSEVPLWALGDLEPVVPLESYFIMATEEEEQSVSFSALSQKYKKKH